jgi:hypothetical protein
VDLKDYNHYLRDVLRATTEKLRKDYSLDSVITQK